MYMIEAYFEEDGESEPTKNWRGSTSKKIGLIWACD
jgi:hypothetical protein